MTVSLLFSSGDLVFVEDPTYFVALKILRSDVGLKCVADSPHLKVHIYSNVQ